MEEIDAQLKMRQIREADRNQGDEFQIYGKSNNNYIGGSMRTQPKRDRREHKSSLNRAPMEEMYQVQAQQSYGRQL